LALASLIALIACLRQTASFQPGSALQSARIDAQFGSAPGVHLSDGHALLVHLT
jgi:hypothetical protein